MYHLFPAEIKIYLQDIIIMLLKCLSQVIKSYTHTGANYFWKKGGESHPPPSKGGGYRRGGGGGKFFILIYGANFSLQR